MRFLGGNGGFSRAYSCLIVILVLANGYLLQGCSSQISSVGEVTAPDLTGPAVDDLPSPGPAGKALPVLLDNQERLYLYSFGGRYFQEVEATLSETAFRDILLKRETTPDAAMQLLFQSIERAQGIVISSRPELGYVRFYFPYEKHLMAQLIKLPTPYHLIMSPILASPEDTRTTKDLAETTTASNGSSVSTTEQFSGLARMRVIDFVKIAEVDIGNGVKVDGSSVKLGITDTGITYNHPTFRSRIAGNHNRIRYLKDFTGEGRSYINSAASFTADHLGGDDFSITAEIIETPRLPSRPVGNLFKTLENLRIRAGGELKKVLIESPTSVRLGTISESVYQGPADAVDLNNNGKLDDLFYFLFVSGATPDEDHVYFDATGTGDFRSATPLRSFNLTSETLSLGMERIGFQIATTKLANAQGSGTLNVRSVALVGYDPGSHGTHVAGIAAGQKTLANDRDDTLARGVAPEAAIYMNRVCANNSGCSALEAFVDLAGQAQVDVINMSLGGLTPQNDGYGVQDTMVNRMSELHNTLFVISAGNSGPGRQTIGSPSVARHALSVAATATPAMIRKQYQWPALASTNEVEDNMDFVLFFSSRGPTAAGGFKPNIAAPGTELSATQLNTAPGTAAGSMVLWGTSMAAPAATGAYALFLDAVRKYNSAHPQERPLPTDFRTLKEILLSSARAFDVHKTNLQTKEKSVGQYTWIDQGMGMVDLVAAWKLLFSARDLIPPSPIKLGGKDIALDYEVLVSLTTPSGRPYDGSVPTPSKRPALGNGLYLRYSSEEVLRPVHIARRLPDVLAASSVGPELDLQLRNSFDEFELVTEIYGSDQEWVKVGSLASPDCWDERIQSSFVVLGRGAELRTDAGSGTGELVPSGASTLNICLNREVMREGLAPGDHGAMITGYRLVNGRKSPLPSFRVPVYFTVPHKVLGGSSGYSVQSKVKSFGLSRNYVEIPGGTSLVQITLEVPRKQPGQACSGIELMGLEGENNRPFFKSRKEGRIANCTIEGAPINDPNKLRLVISRAHPKAGLWDLHVLGFYPFKESAFSMKVDYVVADTSKPKIEGNLDALNGTFTWTVKDASQPLSPHSAKSIYSLTGFTSETRANVAGGTSVFVPNPTGIMRSYPAEATSVTITTGGSSGNDIDLILVACDEGALSDLDPSCEELLASGGATDEERITFRPSTDKLYMARVDGFTIKDQGQFVSNETVEVKPERGTISVADQGNASFEIDYRLSADRLRESFLFNHEWFRSGKFSVVGQIGLRSEDNVLLATLPVKINQAAAR